MSKNWEPRCHRIDNPRRRGWYLEEVMEVEALCRSCRANVTVAPLNFFQQSSPSLEPKFVHQLNVPWLVLQLFQPTQGTISSLCTNYVRGSGLSPLSRAIVRYAENINKMNSNLRCNVNCAQPPFPESTLT